MSNFQFTDAERSEVNRLELDNSTSANEEHQNLIPRHPIQVWIARGIIGLLFIMLIALQIWGTPEINKVTNGNSTVYTSHSTFFAYFFIAIPVISGSLAFVFFLQGGIFRLFAAALVAITFWLGYTVFHLDTSNHYVTVTPSGVSREVGTVSAPIQHEIDFTKTAVLFIDEVPGTRGQKYRLVANATNDGHETQIPICDMMRAALPEIMENASNNRVIIERSPDGSLIPSALRVDASK